MPNTNFFYLMIYCGCSSWQPVQKVSECWLNILSYLFLSFKYCWMLTFLHQLFFYKAQIDAYYPQDTHNQFIIAIVQYQEITVAHYIGALTKKGTFSCEVVIRDFEFWSWIKQSKCCLVVRTCTTRDNTRLFKGHWQQKISTFYIKVFHLNSYNKAV